jgi:hypothetical protein
MAFEQIYLAAETGYWVQNTDSLMGLSVSSSEAEIFLPDTEHNLYSDLTETDAQSVGGRDVYILKI